MKPNAYILRHDFPPSDSVICGLALLCKNKRFLRLTNVSLKRLSVVLLYLSSCMAAKVGQFPSKIKTRFGATEM